MSVRCLLGPVADEFISTTLADLRAAGTLKALGTGRAADVRIDPCDTWEAICGQLPSGWRPDFVAAWLPYTSVPGWVWTAPVPVIGLAGDWNLLWHRQRLTLPRCDLVFCDATGADLIERSGLASARPAILYGGVSDDGVFTGGESERDIDILFIGNLHAPAQGERLPWLARVARLSDRYHVVIRDGIFGDDYRAMLRRAKIVFNRSIRGEFNQRVAEAVAAGALLLQEAGNREVPRILAPGREYVEYTDADLEAKLDHYLMHETERAAIAAAGQAKAPDLSFTSLWAGVVQLVETHWPLLCERAARRVAAAIRPAWTERAWQWITALDRTPDPALPAELAAAQAAGALDADGLLAFASAAPHPAEAANRFNAVLKERPGDWLAGIGLAEALAETGRAPEAVAAAKGALDVLNREGSGIIGAPDGPVWPPGMHRFRAEWERAGWAHAGDPAAEVAAKQGLLRWRLNALAADASRELAHYYEAALARPDMPEARAALGCALARDGRVAESLPHLRLAVSAQPFDNAAARALAQALAEGGEKAEREVLNADRRRLAKAAPQSVPTEVWFAAPEPLSAGSASDPPGVVWVGDVRGLHSLAIVNRELAAAIEARGQLRLSIWPIAAPTPDVPQLPARPELLPCLHRKLDRTAVQVRHQWPPRWNPPPEGRWVLVQPWEFGSLPRDWVDPILKSVDEVWVHSRHVRDTYVGAGIPADRVHLIPLGIDSQRFRPDATPLDLPGAGTFRFLFVGGTVWRKGIDLLLEAFAAEFRLDEPVTLLVKGMGAGTFYRDTAAAAIERYRAQGVRIEVIDRDLSEAELPGLYTACDCLVHPYRGEGFALPVAEAMACGRPVIVTARGATEDFCDDQTAFRVTAKKVPVPPNRAVGLRTVGEPWVYEPDLDALRAALRSLVTDPAAALAKAKAASTAIRQGWTWEHAAAAVENRVRVLAAGGPARRWVAVTHATRRARVTLSMIVRNEEENLPDCLRGLTELFDEIVVADTGSIDRTREIAASLGAKVLDFPWCDDFAAARNASLTAATGDWVMWLDADDRLDDGNRAKLRDLFARLSDENAAYAMKCACVTGGPGTSQTVVDHVRLFRNDPRLRWTYRVHEQILPAIRAMGGGVRWTDVTVRHLGYADPAARRKKLDRDLRLLHLDNASKPDDPFTLFNLGTVCLELGKPAEALPLLRRSLERSKPTDSIVRKLYALVIGCHRRLGQPAEALAACREGRGYYPHDAELLFLEGLLHRERGDAAGAETCWLQLLSRRESDHFASVDAALTGPKARHNLAVLYMDQERYADAETQWKAALAADPNFAMASLGLGEAWLKQGRWVELGQILPRLESELPEEAAVLRSRMHVAREEYAAAKLSLTAAIAHSPDDIRPRVILSHALLKEGTDLPAAERALLDILAMNPDHREAQRNLRVLRARRPTT